ncbi:hypothetical protein VC_2556 [Vibrio cholerae O1 biovar El Tor str. N16961]|uniref:Uncharacterized protein n=1 Tax=Vibrio cholerae serotype O1 (strain ATCC 39315 / El Tor Inaba N16961) TaxID=243277 RepID=Q9KP23_VIBCH|nr:hypothetical protein VC_2556 [Vibrio cholerae O1 biovar El Tor str. N16961]
MADNMTPVVIEHDSQQSQEKRTHSHYVKDSGSRILVIARHHGLDAQLLTESPENSALERAVHRERQRKEQRQKNLEQIIKLRTALAVMKALATQTKIGYIAFLIWRRTFTIAPCSACGRKC